MAALVAVEAVVIALLALLVVGLLRSHADILKALHDLGAPLDGGHAQSHEHPVAGPAVAPPRDASAAAPPVSGVTPTGDALALAVAGASHDTLVAFLSSGCLTCRDLWGALRDGRADELPGVRVVTVTRGEDAESPSQVAELAAGVPVPVVMSSPTWDAYQVPVAPYFVYVDGPSGHITGEGAVGGWDQMVEFLRQAQADDVWERRADKELSAAGIAPGDPRLHHAPFDRAPVDGAPVDGDEPEAP